MSIFTAIKAIGRGISFISRHKTEAIFMKDVVEKGFQYAREYKGKQGPKVEYVIYFSALKEGDYPFFAQEMKKFRISFACSKPQGGMISGEISKVFVSLKRAQLFKGRLPKMLAEYEVKKLEQKEDSAK